MGEKHDIKNLKEALDLVLAGVKVVADAKADGTISVADAGLLLSLIPVVGPAIDGVGVIPAELADLSGEEVTELAAHVMSKLAVDDAKAKKLISAGFKILGGAVEAIGAFKATA